MRTLALDIGDVRIGVAVSDPTGSVATPLTVLDTVRTRKDQRPITRLIEDYEVERIVVGLPVTMAGDEGPQARHVRALAEKVLRGIATPVVYFDERLSSAQAMRSMRDQGVSERDARGSVDKVAAAVFLQALLDFERRSAAVGLPDSVDDGENS